MVLTEVQQGLGLVARTGASTRMRAGVLARISSQRGVGVSSFRGVSGLSGMGVSYGLDDIRELVAIRHV